MSRHGDEFGVRWLFDQNDDGMLMGFLRCILAGTTPRRFWRSFRLQRAPGRLRLILYWLFWSALLLAMWWVVVVAPVAIGASYASGGASSVESVLSPAFYQNAWDQIPRPRYRHIARAMVLAAGVFIIWPWLAWGSALAVSAMRGDTLNPAKLLQCVMYGYDICVWFCCYLIVVGCLYFVASRGRMAYLYEGETPVLAIHFLIGIAACWLVGCAKTILGFRYYLKRRNSIGFGTLSYAVALVALWLAASMPPIARAIASWIYS